MGKIYEKSFVLNFASKCVALTIALSIATPIQSVQAGDSATAGDTAKRLPDVGTICKWLDDAKSGKLVGSDGKDLTFTATRCLSLPPRQRRSADCQQTSTQIVAGNESADADTLCARGNLSDAATSYCNLRTLAKNNQAGEYCDAYNSASHAQDGLTAVLAIDGGAAAVCWTEYAGLKAIYATGTASSITTASQGTGPCSYASMGAGLAEIVNIILANTGKNNHATGEYSIDSSNNVQKKDDKSGLNITKILDIAMSSGLSLLVIRNGLCQQARGAGDGDLSVKKGALASLGVNAEKFCGVLNGKIAQNKTDLNTAAKSATAAAADAETKKNEAQAAATNAEKEFETFLNSSPCSAGLDNYNSAKANLTNAENSLVEGSSVAGGPKVCTKADSDAYDKALSAAKDKVASTKATLLATDATAGVAKKAADAALAARAAEGDATAESERALKVQARTKLQPRIDVTKSSAQMLTALAALRGVSLVAAGSTKKKAVEILQSMFTNSSSGATFGSSGVGGVGTNIYSTVGSNNFSPALPTGGSTSAITAGSPESFLLPNNSPLANNAAQIASTMPASKAQDAASAGASGVSGLISGMASGMGAKGIESEIQAMTASTFANLPKDDGAGYSGGGGAKMAAKGGDSSGGLDLKGLFGAANGEKDEKGAAAGDLAYRSPASEDIWHSQNPKGNNLFQIVSDRYDTAQRKNLAP